MFEGFYIYKLGSSNYKDEFGYAQSLITNGLHFFRELDKELHLYSDTEIMKFIADNIDSSILKTSISFINYVRITCKDCNYQNKYNYTSKANRRTDKELYSKEEFKNMYIYSQNIDFHIENALESVAYAESWFYVIMHFINTWRSMDIIEFPFTNLNRIKTLTKEYLLNHRLTIEESQEVINVVKETNQFLINKTGALNKFFVNRSMLQVVATAILVLEYHYKDTDTDILLPLFHKNGALKKYLSIYLGDTFPDINFSNRVANRTLLTYFHHNASQTSKNGDIVHILSKRLRGHVSEDTINIYVMNSNEDEFFDDISYHLFNRGHFGWLFHSLIEISTSLQEKELTVDEKTFIIQKYQKLYSPTSIEGITQFLLEQQNNSSSVAIEIASMDNSDLIERLGRVFKGYMPSKEDDGQCLYSKACKKPFAECKTCPYLIPKIYLLNSLKEDIASIISELRDIEEYKTIERIKLTTILFKLMQLLNQSVVEFGKDYVSTFININNLRESLIGIDNKLLSTVRKE